MKECHTDRPAVTTEVMGRREALERIGRMGVSGAAALLAPAVLAGAKAVAQVNDRKAASSSFALNYVLSSAMYGKMPISDIVPEAPKTGATCIDIWRLPHGDQREQIEKLGVDAFAAMLKKHDVKLGLSTCYPLGPFRLQEEMAFVKKLGGRMVLCASGGPKEPEGQEAKAGVRKFLEDMKPHIAKAEEYGVTIAIENHGRQLLYHPDALRYFAELNKSKHIGLAFAPHHLHRWSQDIPGIIRDMGGGNIPFFYGQEHSEGMHKQVPKAIEMKQMPGYGDLDYKPIIKALKDADFTGLFEIFMHPTPRGIPILPTLEEVTTAINKSRAYLNDCVKSVA